MTSGRKFLLVYKFGLLVTTQKFLGDVSGTAYSAVKLRHRPWLQYKGLQEFNLFELGKINVQQN